MFNEILLRMNISIKNNTTQQLREGFSVENYCIFLFVGSGAFSVNSVDFEYDGHTILFLSPYQKIEFLKEIPAEVEVLQFHGDFYCIEYHKEEVACNGLLFNNIYMQPHIQLSEEHFSEIKSIFKRIKTELGEKTTYSQAVLRSYLQLILALSSKDKSLILKDLMLKVNNSIGLDFQKNLETYFLTERSVAFYADKAHLSVDTFSKKIKQLFEKSPAKLIQERIVLEAKKQLHLTCKSIKEIAFEMNFEDEFYFSRFFKKAVGLSPKHFRETVGISVVAK
ncbi:Transcriptional regulator, AraC family [Capnocytophaga canis]|uniref:Transcriptional regulator, AraC family n=2 Tax=Capnocytophaga canis TaxID=1848903 RepID=A0A0B7IK32_9FLAO|nr:Transcriptional regulator, AraC family [Capnocytophaga canis]